MRVYFEQFKGNDRVVTEVTGIILCMHPANERWRYTVTPPLIDWVHSNDP